MKADKQGQDFIKHFESCILHPHLCPAGIPTIGWGNTFYPNGKKVTLRDKPLTQTEADILFVFILSMFEKDVTKLIGKTKLPQHQFNAILSFAYNIGSDIDQDDIPEGLGDSTLLKKILANPNDKTIWGEFLVWNKSKGKVLLGLTRRRNAEAHLYFKNEINYYKDLKS